MNEKELYTILQRDDNLREAICHREQKQPPMPADLNDRLMRRLEEPTPNPSPREEPTPNPSLREGRIKRLRWMAAAACLLVIIGVGVTLMPSRETHDEVMTHKSAVVRKESKADAPQPKANITEAPKAVAVAKIKPKKKLRKETAQRKDSFPSTEVAIAEAPCLQRELKPTVLTERDIPITRPENYQYTPEEIALLKKQANDAYVKWVQLELEIAKYNLEQMANNYREQ